MIVTCHCFFHPAKKLRSGAIVRFSDNSSFDWLQGPHIGQNFEKHSKILFSETVKKIKPVLCIHVPDIGLYKICVFYSRQIRTLVAMATENFL